MGALNSYVQTLADYAKKLDPDGSIAPVVELLNQTNEILQDILWKEGNLTTGHRVTVRTGLPAVYWRLMNQGIPSSKATTAQVDEACAVLESWSTIDKLIAELGGNLAANRLDEAVAHIEAMGQELASTLFYGAATNPEEFIGLAARYSSLSAVNGQNIISGKGAGSDNSSIWLVGWGNNSIFGIYPKGTQAGLEREDMGLTTVTTSTTIGGGNMRAYQEKFCWQCGIALKDWRYVVRICNIDISNLVAKSSAADLIELMIKAIHRIPNIASVKPVFYMNRTCFQMLDIFRRDDVISGGGLSFETVDGKTQYSFRGIPVRLCDVLTEAEEAVS
jgi:hypothetical protein